MTQEPLIPGPLYGLRTWRVVDTDEGERLAAPHRGTLWPPGVWLEARCERADHQAPAPGCDCGVHGWHPRRTSARDVLATRRDVPGVVETDGPTEVHADGFRAARGRPYALFSLPGRNEKRIARLAAAYGAEVVPVHDAGDILAWCRERGLGLDEAVVTDLLGPEVGAERRHRRRTYLLRAGLAAGIAAAILAAAIALDPGQPHDKVLHGRNGEIRVP